MQTQEIMENWLSLFQIALFFHATKRALTVPWDNHK